MTYSFTLTRERLAEKVLGKLGVLGSGDAADSNDLAVVHDAIDLRLKELHALGVLWWQVSGATTDVTLTAGVATAAIGATDFLFPVTLALRNGNDDQPIELIGHREYQAIPDKLSQGEPEKAFIAGSTIRLWPVPQSAYTAKLTYEAIADDTAASTAPDIRVESMRSFIDVIAGDLIEEYQTPEPQASRLLAKQAAGLRTIRTLNSQRVDATTVAPEYF